MGLLRVEAIRGRFVVCPTIKPISIVYILIQYVIIFPFSSGSTTVAARFYVQSHRLSARWAIYWASTPCTGRIEPSEHMQISRRPNQKQSWQLWVAFFSSSHSSAQFSVLAGSWKSWDLKLWWVSHPKVWLNFERNPMWKLILPCLKNISYFAKHDSRTYNYNSSGLSGP